MPSRLQQTRNTSLPNRLVLHRFMCREFGYDDMRAMLDRLRDVPSGFDASGESEYVRALYLSSTAPVLAEELAKYDANVARHSLKLRMTAEQGRAWKPYQYLALLFTERYLHRYFHDPRSTLCRLEQGTGRTPVGAGRAGLHARRPADHRLSERDRLRQDSHYARPYPAIPALFGCLGWAAQQRCPADA